MDVLLLVGLSLSLTLAVGLLQPVGSELHHLTSAAPLWSRPEAGLCLLLVESDWIKFSGSRPMKNPFVFIVTV